MPTPHNRAEVSQIAKTVLMPGDPLRAKYIAENFLENAELVNDVRGINGYTGTWKGTKVTVMASGMGMPSIGLYSWELFNFYDVDNIIRIGTAGGLHDDVRLRDVILAQGSSCNSVYPKSMTGLDGFVPLADYTLLSTAANCAVELGLNVKVGNVLADDVYYHPELDAYDRWKRFGVLAVEMEAAALYTNAACANKRALAILTVSNHLYRDEELTTDERQSSLNDMITLALNTAAAMEEK